MADAEIDLYGDVNEEFEVNNSATEAEGDDLYNDIISGNTADVDDDELNDTKSETNAGASSTTNENPEQAPRNFFMHGPVPANRSRHGVYVGNMTWWTTDDQLHDTIESIGVNDILEIKFFENRSNGQSKGLATVLLKSDESVKNLLKKLPQKDLNGQTLICTIASKANLAKFDLTDTRNHTTNGKETKTTPKPTGKVNEKANIGMPRPPFQSVPQSQPTSGPNVADVVRLLAFAAAPGMRPAMPMQNRLPGPSMNNPASIRGGPGPGLPRMDINHQSNNFNSMHRQQRPTMGVPGLPVVSISGPGHNMQAAGQPPPGAHVNPAFFPTVSQAGTPAHVTDQFGRPVAPFATLTSNPSIVHDHFNADRNQTSMFDAFGRPVETVRNPGPDLQISEPEFEELFNRNKTVSSSAINKSVSDARSGDYASAIETLVTAISLIKQSKIANDDRCKILVSSLQDTLHGIEAKSYGSTKPPRRERSRSREREDRKRRRERSRSREYRDRSRERDRYYDERYDIRDRHHRSSRH